MNKADRTRRDILEKAFELIYRNGYQATSIDNIHKSLDVTKGAFYYHFKNKEEMGLAVIKEVVAPRIQKGLIDPMEGKSDPLDAIFGTISTFMLNLPEHQLLQGCPMNNLIQEMAPLNAKFRLALFDILERWKAALLIQLKKAIGEGKVQDNNADEMAQFIINSYEGARSLGKIYQSYAYYHVYLRQLNRFLKKT